ncbi:hypothetical protein EHF33_11030 [Deinococcus psychrotolerans]|uniref:DNA-directed DNA polymerase family A palm domain-containing protein n=1 Tax=Deinococcus psychrotolerans TaxID=2489213 RepID=A0A3G8YG92_9DEIO|nr:hypothetical protein [Deinococcus psychrotolerans]AZI43207.1 hypothetical protein EHF33_11030 [Deinococcus psychrotolerans]
MQNETQASDVTDHKLAHQRNKKPVKANREKKAEQVIKPWMEDLKLLRISKEIRTEILSKYPILKENEAFRWLMAYLLWDGWRDKRTPERIVLPAKLVTFVVSEWSADNKKHWRQAWGVKAGKPITASLMFQQFSTSVLPLHLNPHRIAETCRTCLPACCNLLIEARTEHLGTTATCPVYFVSGRPALTPQHHRKVLQAQGAMQAAHLERLRPDYQRRFFWPLLELLNNTNTQQVSTVLHDNFSHAQEALSKRVSNSASLSYSTALLLQIKHTSMPVLYEPSRKGKSPRISPVDGSGPALALPKEVRQALMRGCWEFDLVSAQLAVVARLWNIEALQSFLEQACDGRGHSIWQELMDAAGLPQNGSYKPLLKEFVYACCYGMRLPALKDLLLGRGKNHNGRSVRLTQSQYGALMLHPLLRELLKARDNALAKAEQNGKVVVPFLPKAEQRFALKATDKAAKKYSNERRATARSALACASQAVELWLLMPTVEVLKRFPATQIIAHQYDGFTVAGPEYTLKEMAPQLIKAVDEQMRRYGIASKLDGKLLT